MIIPRTIDGRLKVIYNVAPTFWNGGFGYDNFGSLVLSDVAPGATSVYNSGLQTDSSGRIHVASGGTPVAWPAGMPVDVDGKLCVTEGGIATVWTAGVPLTTAGLVAIDSSEFFAPLDDLGNGEVNLALAQGTGSATFTRATVATCRLKDGTLKKVASGVARAHYLASGAYGGYLAENARTNLCLRSEEIDNASWTKTDTTVSADNLAAPDGTITAELLTEGVAGTASVGQAVTATANVVSSHSRFFKRGNTDWVLLEIINGVNFVRAWFNLATGAVGSTTVGGTGVLGSAPAPEAWLNGWYRCTLNGNLGGVITAYTLNSQSANADASTTRVNNATRYEWGAQFEDNIAFASSYIPTTTASVTRNGDSLAYTTAGNVGATAGSYCCEIPFRYTTGVAGFGLGVSISDGTANERVVNQIQDQGATDTRHLSFTGGVATGVTDIAQPAYPLKHAGRYIVNDFNAALNGVIGTADTTVAVPAGLAQIHIAQNQGGGEQLFGTIKNVRIWKSALSNGVLQDLTT